MGILHELNDSSYGLLVNTFLRPSASICVHLRLSADHLGNSADHLGNSADHLGNSADHLGNDVGWLYETSSKEDV